jgi:hypothetical protein
MWWALLVSPMSQPSFALRAVVVVINAPGGDLYTRAVSSSQVSGIVRVIVPSSRVYLYLSYKRAAFHRHTYVVGYWIIHSITVPALFTQAGLVVETFG